MHVFTAGKAQRPTSQALDAGPQGQMWGLPQIFSYSVRLF